MGAFIGRFKAPATDLCGAAAVQVFGLNLSIIIKLNTASGATMGNFDPFEATSNVRTFALFERKHGFS